MKFQFESPFVIISPDRRYVACYDADENDVEYIYLFDVESGKLLHTIKDPGWGCSFSPDSRKIAFSERGVFDIIKGKFLFTLKNMGYSVAFNSDGKHLAVGGNGPIYLIDVASGELLQTFGKSVQPTPITTIQFSPDDRFIISGSNENITLWNMDSSVYKMGVKLNTEGFDYKWGGASYLSPSQMYYALSFPDSTYIWDKTSGKQLPLFVSKVLNFAFSHDNRHILISQDTSFYTYDISTRKCIKKIVSHDDYLCDSAFSPDDKYIVSMSLDNDNIIHIWDANTGECIHTLHGYFNACFSPIKHQLALISDTAVSILDVSTGRCILTTDKVRGVGNIAISPDGKKLLLIIQNHIFIYDSRTGKHISLNGHARDIHYAAFSPDGKNVVSSAESTCVWDVATGQCIQKISEVVWNPVFSSDGRQIQFVKNNEGGLFLCTWDFLPLEELISQVRERFKDNPLTPEERRQYYLE